MSCGIELVGRVDVARPVGLQDAGQVEVGELWYRASGYKEKKSIFVSK